MAKGGIISADTGFIDTTIGPKTVTFGDNPTGIETHAFIPHNDSEPVMKRLNQMFGKPASGGSRVTSINLNANINVYTKDGNFLGTARIRKRFTFENLEAH
jgi:hypothetical protein